MPKAFPLKGIDREQLLILVRNRLAIKQESYIWLYSFVRYSYT